jgi:hypothetical protein
VSTSVNVNVERVEALAAALESGEFQQARGRLRSADGSRHCCLGVATELFNRSEQEGSWVNSSFYLDGRDWDGVLPPAVRDWYGFADENPYLDLGDGREIPAATLNDGDTGDTGNGIESRDFAELAALFRRTYCGKA